MNNLFKTRIWLFIFQVNVVLATEDVTVSVHNGIIVLKQPPENVLNHADSLPLNAKEAKNIDYLKQVKDTNDDSTNSIVTNVTPVMVGVHHETDDVSVLDDGIQNLTRFISSPGLNSTQEETSTLTKLRSTKVKALLTVNSGTFWVLGSFLSTYVQAKRDSMTN